MMLDVFIGADSRQPLSAAVAAYSVSVNSLLPVRITLLHLNQLPIERTGLTEFTYTRYLVPRLMDYDGYALFMDADQVVDGDIAELWKLTEEDCAVWVAKHLTPFEWPAVMLFNCSRCRKLTPIYIETQTPQPQNGEFLWADGPIGTLPPEWAYTVGYDHTDIKPKLIHYTAGIPIWPETRNSRHADVWHRYHRQMNASVAYNDLMATSVHHKRVVSKDIER